MDNEKIAPVIRRRITRAVHKGLNDSMGDPFWDQLEDAELDARAPLVDVQDRNDHFLLVAELPGIPKDKVDVSIEDNVVELTGENVLECEIGHEDLAYLCNERSVTNFHRRVPLPEPVIPGDAEANMADGVLVIKLPKRPTVSTGTVKLRVD